MPSGGNVDAALTVVLVGGSMGQRCVDLRRMLTMVVGPASGCDVESGSAWHTAILTLHFLSSHSAHPVSTANARMSGRIVSFGRNPQAYRIGLL